MYMYGDLIIMHLYSMCFCTSMKLEKWQKHFKILVTVLCFHCKIHKCKPWGQFNKTFTSVAIIFFIVLESEKNL